MFFRLIVIFLSKEIDKVKLQKKNSSIFYATENSNAFSKSKFNC